MGPAPAAATHQQSRGIVISKLFNAVKTAGSDFIEDECMTAGAAIAYYTIFSLPPLLVIVFMIAEAFHVPTETINRVVKDQAGLPVAQQMGSGGEEEEDSPEERDAAASSAGSGSNPSNGNEEARDGNEEMTSQGSAPPAGGTNLGSLVERTEETPSVLGTLGPLSKVVGIVVLLFSATGVFAQLQSALNRAWEVEPDPEQGGLMSFLGKRLVSAGMIVVIAFLLLVSFVLTTIIDEILQWIQGTSPDAVATTIGMVLNVFVTFVIATGLFAAMFKILPDAKMRWQDMWVAAGITAVLFIIGKTAIGWYVQNSDLGSSWGSAAASMIGMLVWVYYTSLIVLFGAELAQYWARHFGAGIEPASGAVRIHEEKHHLRGEAAP